MTMMTNTPRATFGASIATTFSGLLDAVRAWSVANDAADELHKLSERELADIGMTRGDIEAVARSLASGKRH